MNPSTAQAQVIVDELVRCGVTDAVLCPGSRNAPLSFALQAADAAGRLRLHVRTDERTAGFLALGLALGSSRLGSGRPVPVCTTSGTAVANLHPAVLEASHAGVALLALTADRPPQMIGVGANQTIAASGIFGGTVRLAMDAVVAGEVADHGQWRALVDRAVAAATGALGGPPGPVHLNLPFAEPLVPDGTGVAPAGRPGGGPWTDVAPVTRSAPPLPVDPTAPTLVVAGHGAPVLDVPVPVVAEPAAAAWPAALRAGPWLLGTAAALKPAQVIVAGRPTLHRPVQRLLADPDVAVYALADPDGRSWTDVAGTVRAVGALPVLDPDPRWLQRWTVADRAAGTALDRAFDGAPTGLRLARSLVAALPDGARLVLGSSNPVRDVSLGAIPRAGLTVLANRGVAGIDGTVSTAVGAALAAPPDAPTYALLGDLTLLHDTTGLVIGPDEPRPDLTVVVLNDDGGGIFGLLEQGAPEYAPAFERVFGTPHGVDLAALCAATGVAHVRVDAADVAAALAPAPGLRMVEVPAQRSSLRTGHARLRAAVAAAVAELRLDAGW